MSSPIPEDTPFVDSGANATSEDISRNDSSASDVPVRDRWLGALCYLSILVIIPILAPARSPFLARHCRQGFALFFAEVVGVAAILIIDSTLGRIPLLGFILVIVLRLVFFLTALSLSVLGCTKALFGEDWRLPYLDDLADRLPINAQTR